MIVTLSLTSLIDAFSILVIYLLLVTQNGNVDIDLHTKVTIPQTESAPFITEAPLVIRITNQNYHIGNDLYPESLLKQKIQQEIKNNPKLKVGIQAGKKESYKNIERLVQTIRLSGVEKIEFLSERIQ